MSRDSNSRELLALARYFMTEHRTWPLFSQASFLSDDRELLVSWWEKAAEIDPRWTEAKMFEGDRNPGYSLDLFYVPNEDLLPGYFHGALSCYLCLCRQTFPLLDRDKTIDSERIWPWKWLSIVQMIGRHDARVRPIRTRYWNHDLLPEGLVHSRLPCGVFRASSFALESVSRWDRVVGDSIAAARNEFCHCLACKGVLDGEIARLANVESEEEGWGWGELKGRQAVHAAIKAHCKKAGVPFPWKRPPRPRRRRQ